MTAPVVLFAHGSGAGQTHPFMQAWREWLATFCEVETFEYDYMKAGKKFPDRMPALIARHRAALDEVIAKYAQRKIFFAGKSMGSRVGCHLANELAGDAPTGLICLGYPLKGRTAVRDEVLRDLRRPILFVQGTRDPLCPLDLLAEVRPQMRAPSELHVVQGGDHSLKLRRKDERELSITQEESDRLAVVAVRGFIERLCAA